MHNKMLIVTKAGKEDKLTARPTAPSPKTATVEPFFGFATFKVAPRPERQNQIHLRRGLDVFETHKTEEVKI